MQVKPCVNCKHFNRGYMGKDVCKSPELTSIDFVYGHRVGMEIRTARNVCGEVQAKHFEANEPVSRYRWMGPWLKSL